MKEQAAKVIGKAVGLRGRQKIVGWWRDGDEVVFNSNAKGGYGEIMTFHFESEAALLKETGLTVADL